MISPSFSCGLCFLKINPTQPSIFNRLTAPASHSISDSHGSPIRFQTEASRRQLLSIIIAAPFLCCESSYSSAQTETEKEKLESYTDTMEGFTLLRPSSWIKVDKAGATVLFEDPNKGSNNVGVVVTPVRLTSLRDFGDPQFVSNKLIQAEKRKESTKDVEIVSFKERPENNKDVQVYEFEYIIDSTRGGVKRIFSAAFVASKKLYLLNIAHSDNPQQPITNQTRIMLEQVLHSFVPSSSSTIM